MIPEGQTSLTDHAEWRDFCARAAEDLSLLDDDDPDSILNRTLEAPEIRLPRYERVTLIISRLLPFSDLNDVYVSEIGGGYGGQALSILQKWPRCHYRIHDLDEAERLELAFISSRGFKFDHSGRPTDLFLSSFALSELVRHEQKAWLHNAALAPYGFIYWNGWLAGEVTLGETIDRLPEQVRIDPCPDHPRNRILTWKPT